LHGAGVGNHHHNRPAPTVVVPAQPETLSTTTTKKSSARTVRRLLASTTYNGATGTTSETARQPIGRAAAPVSTQQTTTPRRSITDRNDAHRNGRLRGTGSAGPRRRVIAARAAS